MSDGLTGDLLAAVRKAAPAKVRIYSPDRDDPMLVDVPQGGKRWQTLTRRIGRLSIERIEMLDDRGAVVSSADGPAPPSNAPEPDRAQVTVALVGEAVDRQLRAHNEHQARLVDALLRQHEQTTRLVAGLVEGQQSQVERWSRTLELLEQSHRQRMDAEEALLEASGGEQGVGEVVQALQLLMASMRAKGGGA